MKAAAVLIALAAFWPLSSSAQPPFGRQLHYVGTRTLGDEREPIRIDLDIGRMDSSDVATWIVIDEHVGDRDLGPLHATLDKSGAVGNETGRLTFEEETLLEMVALQFEDVDGVDPGDHWVRTGVAGGGMRRTLYVVRSAADGMIGFEVARTVDEADGRRGSCQGIMRYDARTAAPTSLELSGEAAGGDRGRIRPLQFSAQLVEDSFQPHGN